MPLGAETAGNYCQYCVDESGALKPYEEVRAGIAQWLSSWTPETVTQDPTARAAAYMKAMPAWADR